MAEDITEIQTNLVVVNWSFILDLNNEEVKDYDFKKIIDKEYSIRALGEMLRF